jgi:tetratricopeptide (TPR) repeat protein
MDESGKDGDRRYSDFLIWAELLDLAAAKKCPVIFVTSEDKEDWWEKYSGRRVGPRPELLKEAFEKSGQRILIYRTDQFIEIAATHTGTAVEPNVLEEIREIQESSPTSSDDDRGISNLSTPELAHRAIKQRDFATVIDLYRPYLQSNPQYHVGWIELGYALREIGRKKKEAGDPQGALVLFQESLSALNSAMEHRDVFYRAEAEYHKSKTLIRIGALTRDPARRTDAVTAARRAQDFFPLPKYESWLNHLLTPR